MAAHKKKTRSGSFSCVGIATCWEQVAGRIEAVASSFVKRAATGTETVMFDSLK